MTDLEKLCRDILMAPYQQPRCEVCGQRSPTKLCAECYEIGQLHGSTDHACGHLTKPAPASPQVFPQEKAGAT